MSLSLSSVLSHPVLHNADPVVRTGVTHLDRAVRWIHSSEVLEIARLLHGGELLLTGGAVLARSTAAERRRYVRELSTRRVAGVAIETGSRLASIPTDLLDEAAQHDFPVIELRAVVPFVDVAEAINGFLVDSSVTRLKYSTELAHVLSGVVGEGGGAQEILDVVVHRVDARAALFDNAGDPIAAAPDGEDDDSGTTTGEPGDTGDPGDTGGAGGAGVTSPVTVHGVHAATLVLYPADGADTELLHLAADRTSEALGFALLRTRPPSTRDLAVSELVRLCGDADASTRRIRHLGDLIGVRPEAPVVGIVAGSDRGASDLSRLDSLLRHHGRTVLDRPAERELHAVVSLAEHTGPGRRRADLLADLRRWSGDHDHALVVVGPAYPDLAGAPASLSAALTIFGHGRTGNERIVDAREEAATRLLDGDGRHARLEQIAREQIALFAAVRPRDREVQLESLLAYFEAGCNKSAAAARLHVERQTLHARLRRAFELLGGDPTGTPVAMPLHLALRLWEHRGDDLVVQSVDA